MAKVCNVCKQSYSDELAVCPHCSSAIEIVLGDAPKSGGSAAKPKTTPPLRVEGSSDSDIEIDLGKLPPPAAGDSPSATSNVKWSTLVDRPGESGVDLAASGLVVDSPSDAALLGRKPEGPARGEKGGSWVDIGVSPPGGEDDESGIVIAAAGGQPGIAPVGPGSGSDDDIDLARLEAEARAKEGKTPPGGTRPPHEVTGSDSEIDLGALAAGGEGDTSARFAEHLLFDDASAVDLAGKSKPAPGEGPSGLDLVAEALESGVDLGGTGEKAVTVPGDSGVDLAALFEDEPPAAKRGGPRPADTSAVDLGASPPSAENPLARAVRTPTSSDAKLADLGQSDVQLADSGRSLRESDVGLAPPSGKLAGSDVELAGSDVGLAGSSKSPKPGSDVELAGSDVELAGSSKDRAGGSDVQLAGDSDVGLAGGSDVRLADSAAGFGESDVQLAGESSRRRTGQVPLATPVGRAGSGRPAEDHDLDLLATGPALADEPRMADDELLPPRVTVPPEKAPGRAGAWVGGGILGALLGTAATVAVWLSGLFSGEQPPPRPAAPAQASLEVAKLKEEVERLKPFEADSQQKTEQLAKYEEATEKWKEAVTKLKDENANLQGKLKTASSGGEAVKTAQAALAKAEAARKQAEEQAEKTRQQAAVLAKQAEEAAAREVALKKELDEAKKAADPKAMELFKKEREGALAKLKEAESKLADAEKARKEAEAKAADLAKAKKDADLKVADAEKARQSADQKVVDLTAALKEAKGGKPDTAMAKLLEGARTEAAEAKKRLDAAMKKVQDAEKIAEAARAESEKARKDAATAAKAAEAAQIVRTTMEQKLKDFVGKFQAAEERAKAAAEQLAAATAARLKAEKTAEFLTRQLAEAKATPGGARATFPREAADPLEAEEQYALGLRSYHDGDYAQAERSFTEAGRNGGQDARYLYFLGLARLAQGKREAAEADFREAARLERQSRPSRSAVNAALERIQGAARQALERHR